ncbi:hypothetical protein H2204_001129 [Knufia peltigerae]|uniref:Glycosyltransferase family 69 protein n=1 Tax=Knufia peltigerae TaxID=1002370 RepID=A0AA38YDP5_9EURO|nr:hypothetical protein H2204_001129 [Knufia peltigerae]
MSVRSLQYDENSYELSGTSTNDTDEQDLDLPFYEQDASTDDLQAHLLTGNALLASAKPDHYRLSSLTPTWLRKQYISRRSRTRTKRLARRCSCSPRSFARRFALFCYTFITTIVVIVLVGGVFFPGYTHLPPHYKVLKRQVLASEAPGRANLQGQKIFIAASLSDKEGKLFSGDWGRNVLELIQILGPENTFLSIYVNDSGPESKQTLEEFERRVPCEHDLVFEDHLDWSQLKHVTLPGGSQRVKRIEYLSEVRNRALLPLDKSTTIFDKLLYLNDVYFRPLDAAQLLLSTHTIAEGRTDYRAACAVDFINPFKFYDTYATRDLEGYGMGLPFFPWFSANGDEQSHQDVLDGTDAVRVKSCWGGMVAFDAAFFQKQPGSEHTITSGNQSPSNLSAPYRFRAEKDTFWDASECCLIHADIQNPEPGKSGIYMNPFVRVAYDTKTLSWLGFTRRFERLYTPIHWLLDFLTNTPRHNPRRDEEPWQPFIEMVWLPDSSLEQGGSFQQMPRMANHAGFCGRRGLAVMKENADLVESEHNWENIPIPS